MDSTPELSKQILEEMDGPEGSLFRQKISALEKWYREEGLPKPEIIDCQLGGLSCSFHPQDRTARCVYRDLSLWLIYEDFGLREIEVEDIEDDSNDHEEGGPILSPLWEIFEWNKQNSAIIELPKDIDSIFRQPGKWRPRPKVQR